MLRPTFRLQAGWFERVWRSDTLVDDNFAAEIRALATALDQEADASSRERVRRLVDPNMYPLIYGSSLFVRDDDSSVPEAVPAPDQEVYYASTSHAWLPSDFAVSDDGTSVSIVSPYINNVDPASHPSARSIFERLVACAVPLWERVLSDLRRPLIKFRIETVAVDSPDNRARQYDAPCLWVDNGSPMAHQLRRRGDLGAMQADIDEWFETHPRRLPDALPTYDGALERIRDAPKVSLKGRTLQVVVDMSSVHLEPSEPVFEGEAWHVAGATLRLASLKIVRLISASRSPQREDRRNGRLCTTFLSASPRTALLMPKGTVLRPQQRH